MIRDIIVMLVITAVVMSLLAVTGRHYREMEQRDAMAGPSAAELAGAGQRSSSLKAGGPSFQRAVYPAASVSSPPATLPASGSADPDGDKSIGSDTPEQTFHSSSSSGCAPNPYEHLNLVQSMASSLRWHNKAEAEIAEAMASNRSRPAASVFEAESMMGAVALD